MVHLVVRTIWFFLEFTCIWKLTTTTFVIFFFLSYDYFMCALSTLSITRPLIFLSLPNVNFICKENSQELNLKLTNFTPTNQLKQVHDCISHWIWNSCPCDQNLLFSFHAWRSMQRRSDDFPLSCKEVHKINCWLLSLWRSINLQLGCLLFILVIVYLFLQKTFVTIYQESVIILVWC